MESTEVDVCIIGGGIIGLTVAYELKKRFPGQEIALLEATAYPGDQSTGRNSGVLHAGLYYPTGSLKHLLCLEGLELWIEDFCRTLSIPFRQTGKVIFARNSKESGGLDALWKKAHDNGVKSLVRLSSSDVLKMSTFVNLTEGFFSPNTGILDVPMAVLKIKNAFENMGGIFLHSTNADEIFQREGKYLIHTHSYSVSCEKLINVAGLNAPELRMKLGLSDVESFFVKGNYISSPQSFEHPHLFYPVPPSDLKGLGVHSTIDLGGKTKFGPNTEDVTSIDYSDSGLALPSMKSEILATFKGVDGDRLYWDYAGVRSKIRNANTKELYTDFWIKSPLPGYVECLGIESPGLTSAPAIAKKIVKDFF